MKEYYSHDSMVFVSSSSSEIRVLGLFSMQWDPGPQHCQAVMMTVYSGCHFVVTTVLGEKSLMSDLYFSILGHMMLFNVSTRKSTCE